MTEPLFLLDSNILIYILQDVDCVPSRHVQSCAVGTVVTSAIVYSEVMRGIVSREPQRAHQAEQLFELIPVLPYDAAAAATYARLPFRRGRLDRLIAAHALSAGLTLVTNNEADFADVAGLRIENWTVA
ncbi:type II toxin-antitoxin system VapC family toxin [Sphingobium rhizovicinum]|uniref:Ribonuclease VapC n=1 Tax=Sphingobium rhizovicinum TaxID=432308 RepID=A0ABV7NBV8_9SPHN